MQYKSKHDSWLHRSPDFFFKAWARLIEKDPAAGRALRFHHIGTVPPWLGPMAERHGVRELCVLHGTVANQRLPEVLASMDAFLSTSVKPERGPDYCLASKTFDYVGARKPIIGFVVAGSQLEFLERSGLGLVADPDDPDDGARKLADLIAGHFVPSLNTSYVNGYQRRAGAERLARVIGELCAARADTATPVVASEIAP